MVSLRPVTAADEEFLLRVYGSTRADEMALINWNQDQKDMFVQMQFHAQQQYYAATFPQGEHRIILDDGEPVGRIYTAVCEDEFRILDITVLPDQRNKGIGTPLIKGILARGELLGKPVRVFVENYNPSKRLFERLGFSKIDDDGLSLRLEWRPAR